MTDPIAGRYSCVLRVGKRGHGSRLARLRSAAASQRRGQSLHAWIADDAELRRRFAREGARARPARARPSALRLRREDFLVMELVDGASLAELHGRVLRLGTGSELAVPIASALASRPWPGDRPPRPHARKRLDRERHRTRRGLGLGLARLAHSSTSVTTRDAARDAGATVARAGARSETATRTCMPSAACCSGCSPDGHPSKGRSAGGRAWPRPRGRAVPRLVRARRSREAVVLVDALLASDGAAPESE